MKYLMIMLVGTAIVAALLKGARDTEIDDEDIYSA